MAALPCAARKLGSRALQRAQAGVERRVLPRSTRAVAAQPPPSNIVGEKIADETEVARRIKEIHNKREELYNLSAELARSYKFPNYWAAFQNRRLRQRLSVQVDPRPHDPDWRWLRATKRVDDFLAYTSCVVASYMVTDSLVHWIKKADGK